MSAFGTFNWFDIVILFALALGLMIGYTQGLLRQVVGLAVIYLALILATQYYLPLSDFILRLFFSPSTRYVNFLAFFFVYFLVSAGLNFLVRDAYRMTKLRLYPAIDQLGGSFIGLVSVILLLTIFLPIIRFVAAEPQPYFDNLRSGVVQGFANSRLVPVFHLYQQDLLNLITPWLPGKQLPSIFNL